MAHITKIKSTSRFSCNNRGIPTNQFGRKDEAETIGSDVILLATIKREEY